MEIRIRDQDSAVGVPFDKGDITYVKELIDFIRKVGCYVNGDVTYNAICQAVIDGNHAYFEIIVGDT